MQCPVCKETQLVMSNRENVEIDYCPQCRGVWLDRGELDKITERSQRETVSAQQAPVADPNVYRADGGPGGRHGGGHGGWPWLKKRRFSQTTVRLNSGAARLPVHLRHGFSQPFPRAAPDSHLLKMRRFVLIILMAFLPLQLSWGAAASYCQHEQSAGVSHFGHHDHQHRAAPVSADKATADAGISIDNDCGICQLGSTQPMASKLIQHPEAPLRSVLRGPDIRYSSHISNGLERPDRTLAA